MGDPHRCLNCGKVITWRFALCTKCEQLHGSSTYQWPGWLRYYWKDVQRERRQNVRISRHERPLNE